MHCKKCPCYLNTLEFLSWCYLRLVLLELPLTVRHPH
nr:MAG TPA: hypothetical protein [Caudoviricetes sp.]